jgi:hypothetical protein
MGTKRITEIEILKQETLIIRQPSGRLRPFCPACGGTQPMLTPEEAAALSAVSLRAIFRWIETDIVHFQEMPEGQLYVCANSLPSLDGNKTLSEGEGSH